MHNDITEELGMSINYSDIGAIELISDYIMKYLDAKVLIMCIGTDKCIGDCLAPLVGSILVKNNYVFPVIGTLDNPVHAINIQSIIKKTKSKYPEHFTIAIDACIGLIDCVGDIQIKSCPIYPGKGVGKSLPHIGDISIVGVVDTLDTSDLFTIRNIRLSFVMKMAEVIANSLMRAVDKVKSPVI